MLIRSQQSQPTWRQLLQQRQGCHFWPCCAPEAATHRMLTSDGELIWSADWTLMTGSTVFGIAYESAFDEVWTGGFGNAFGLHNVARWTAPAGTYIAGHRMRNLANAIEPNVADVALMGNGAWFATNSTLAANRGFQASQIAGIRASPSGNIVTMFGTQANDAVSVALSADGVLAFHAFEGVAFGGGVGVSLQVSGANPFDTQNMNPDFQPTRICADPLDNLSVYGCGGDITGTLGIVERFTADLGVFVLSSAVFVNETRATLAVCCDGDGNVWTGGGGDVLLKYNPAGALLLTVPYSPTVIDLACDSAGNVYAISSREASPEFGGDEATLASFDSAGNTRWSFDHGANLRCINIDSSDNIYVGGAKA